MRQASKRIPDSAEKTVRDIRRATRRHHSAEEKIRIVLAGLRGEDSIAEHCRRDPSSGIRRETPKGRSETWTEGEVVRLVRPPGGSTTAALPA